MPEPIHPSAADHLVSAAVPDEAVMLLRYPLPAGQMGALVGAAEKLYGKGLEIRTDVRTASGWMVIARAQNTKEQ